MITYKNNEKQWRRIVEYLFASLCYSKFTAHSIFYNACHHRHKLHYYHQSLNAQIKDIPPKSTFFPCKGKNKNHSLMLWTDYFSVINMYYFLNFWSALRFCANCSGVSSFLLPPSVVMILNTGLFFGRDGNVSLTYVIHFSCG